MSKRLPPQTPETPETPVNPDPSESQPTSLSPEAESAVALEEAPVVPGVPTRSS